MNKLNFNNISGVLLSAILAAGILQSAHATNGMNMEAYGPIAMGLGGTSMAYDNGTAAVINNPATLGLAGEGSRLDLALGFLGPDVQSSLGGKDWTSDADAFYMPAFGWSTKRGRLSYGLASFAQGGMGTEYDQGPGASMAAGLMSSGDTATGAGMPTAATIAATAALQERTQIGVGRLMAPLTYEINDRLVVGGTADFVWATMDLQMVMGGKQMFDMIGSGQISGDMVAALQGAMGSGAINDIYHGYFNFSDNNDFTGKAKTTGFAGKIGLVYKLSKRLTVGATYHSKVELDKFDGRTKVDMAVSGDTGFLGGGGLSGSYADAVFNLRGDIVIKDFSWPAMFAGGVAFRPSERWFLTADIKRIKWSDAMESFTMQFRADKDPANGDFAGLTLKATMPQDWDDQTVLHAGAAWRATDKLTLRAGVNLADNPVPDSKVLYIFPAIVENHYMGGLGYAFNDRQSVDFALSYAPEVTVTNSVTGMETNHSQLNWQLMYSHFF